MSRYLKTLRSHLKRFAQAFHTNIGSVTAGMIEQWLVRLKVGPRARNNNRASVILTFSLREETRLSGERRTDRGRSCGQSERPWRETESAQTRANGEIMRKANGKNALYLRARWIRGNQNG